MRIAVKYCGGCNPEYERADLVSRLARIIGDNQPDWQLVSMQDEPYDLIIVVNGCAVGCVGKKFTVHNQPALIVAGERLQNHKVSEKDLPQALYRKLLEFSSSHSATGREQ